MEEKEEGKFLKTIEKNKDDNTKILTNYEKLKVPGKLIIGQYTYIYKDKSKSDENTFFYMYQKLNSRIII